MKSYPVFILMLIASFWAAFECLTYWIAYNARNRIVDDLENIVYCTAAFIIPFTILYCLSAWVCSKKGTVTP